MTELETRIIAEIDDSTLMDLTYLDFLDQSDIDDLIKELEDTAKKAVPNLAKGLESWIEFEIKTQQLIDTGNMLGSIYNYQTDELSIFVDVAATENGHSYPEGLELGTKPHMIEGNPFLYWSGADHPVGRVYHPGTSPTPFVQPAREALEAQIEEAFE